MRNICNRLMVFGAMTAVCIVMLFATICEDTFAASKPPAKPKITKATVVNNNTVNLKWGKAKNAVKYKVYRKKADGRYVLIKTTAKRSYQNKKLAYGTKYTYKVTAVSKAGKKKTSKIKVVFTKPAKPVITAKIQGINSVKVTWKSTKGAIKYKVYRKKAGGKYVLVKTTASTVYLGNGLAYDAKYTYKVRAVSKNNKFTESKAKTITTGMKPAVQTPAVPDGPAASNTPVTPDTPVVPEEPDIPSEPAEPSIPETPAEPEQPAERTVMVKIPIYEDDTVYWIKYKGEIIFRTTDPQAFTGKQTECWSLGMGISYGTNGSGPEYQIIVGWDEFTVTETDFYDGNIPNRIAAGEPITVTWND